MKRMQRAGPAAAQLAAQRLDQALQQLPRAELTRLVGTLLAGWHSAVAGEARSYEIIVRIAREAGEDA
jgi:hypothetical protein